MNGKSRKRIRDAIHTILIAEWDPIGVNSRPDAHNEYDSYVSGILRLLMAGTDKIKMIDHLRRLEQDSMGLPERDADTRERVAEMLLTLDK